MKNQESGIRDWFDSIYARKGLNYLRPEPAYRIFHTLINPTEGGRHLDVACGPGVLIQSFHALTEMDYHGIDISSVAIQMAEKACPYAKFECHSAESLPYPDQFFDSVTCIGSLERMIHREVVLAEIMRVTRPGGTVCMMVRNAEHISWKYILEPLGLRNDKGHQDARNLQQWSHLFESSGFEIKAIHPDHWPWYRLIRWVPFVHSDTSQVRRFPGSIRHAYEFIYTLGT